MSQSGNSSALCSEVLPRVSATWGLHAQGIKGRPVAVERSEPSVSLMNALLLRQEGCWSESSLGSCQIMIPGWKIFTWRCHCDSFRVTRVKGVSDNGIGVSKD